MGLKTDNQKKMSQEEPDPIPCLWGKGFRWRMLSWRMLSYRKGRVQEALGGRRMTRTFLVQEWVGTAARASASAPRTPCAIRGRAEGPAPPLPGEWRPTGASSLQGPSEVVSADSLSLFFSQPVQNSLQIGAYRRVRSQSHENPLRDTHRLVQGLTRFMPRRLLINVNNLYKEEKDILQKWLLGP